MKSWKNLEVTKNDAQRQIAHAIQQIDSSIPRIISGAVNLALQEESDNRAWEVFDYARMWNIEDHKTFDADQYLTEIEKLREMTKTAGMGVAYKELSQTVEFMEEHYDDLQHVLTGFRKIQTFEGLRGNWSAN